MAASFFLATFAAVNAKTKRHIASWVLLAAFLPMLVVASLHIHPQVSFGGDACTECIHHHCGGHLTQQTTPFHACVLCQFLTLTMLAVAVATVYIYNKVCRTAPDCGHRNVCVAHSGMVGLRAPPAVW